MLGEGWRSFSFEPSRRKLKSKERKEENKGSEKGEGVTQQKLEKPHTRREKPRKTKEQRKGMENLKCNEIKQSQAVIKQRNRKVRMING